MRNILTLVLLLPACSASSPNAADPASVGDTDASSTPSPASPPTPAGSPGLAEPSPDPAPVTTDDAVQVDVINRCSDTVDFCVEVGRSQKQTRLAASAHEVYEMRAGDTVKRYVDQRCGEVIYEAEASPAKQEAFVCK